MTVSREIFDVAVVGGGPAGASVAILLAQAGFEVVLLDRAHFPRDKACGEFLTPQTRTLLSDIGAWDALQRAGLRTVAATVLVAPDGKPMRHTPANGLPTGYGLRRMVLDATLLETARRTGVRVHEGFAVREVLRDTLGCVVGVSGRNAEGVPVEIGSRLVIGADGSHSLIARQLGLVRPLPRLQRVALVSHWNGVSGSGDTIEMRARGETVCGFGFPGSSAEAEPVQGLTANVTLVVPTAEASRIAGRAGDFVEETLTTQFPDLAARLSGASRETSVRTVGCFGHVSRPAVASGAMLVGDAATFIDPFTGEGVYFALRGSQLAAETAIEALHAKDTSLARLWPYHKARRELARRYLLCDVVQSVVRRPALLHHVVCRMTRHSSLAERLLTILGDIRPPTDVFHPGFLWQLLAPEL